MATIEDLRSWIERDIRRGGGWDKNVEVIEFEMTSCRIRFYTDTNCYGISARDPQKTRGPGEVTSDFDDGYLGCIASTRKPRAGEAWTRGNDLADGPLSEDTWRCILADIVAYELVKVHRPKEDGIGIPEVPVTIPKSPGAG